jgi:AraC-like DNA-binding protein
MPDSILSAFSDAEDFGTAMRAEGCISFLITARGQFRARLIQLSLNEMRLAATEEELPRIAFVAVPEDVLTIVFPVGTAVAPVCGGLRIRVGELMTASPGTRFHARSDGALRWGMIRLTADRLSQYGIALRGPGFSIAPALRLWRPPSAAGRHLRSLFSAAIRMVVRCPHAVIDAEASHGLEQQLLHVLVDCLAKVTTDHEPRDGPANQDIMVRFEQLIERGDSIDASMTQISTQLGVSERRLRHLCAEHLGMSPASYDRCRRMSLARRTLRRLDPSSPTVAAIARLNGFRDPGRFAIKYRATFGELPSATLRHARLHSQRRPR